MRIEWFLWEDKNREHVERHAVTAHEVDELLESRHFIIRARAGRYGLCGQTFGGRYLIVFFDHLGDGEAYPVTARDMDCSERRRFKKLI